MEAKNPVVVDTISVALEKLAIFHYHNSDGCDAHWSRVDSIIGFY